jgi:hypothetical protein
MSNRSPSSLHTDSCYCTSDTPRLESQEKLCSSKNDGEGSSTLYSCPVKGTGYWYQYFDGSRCLFECNDPFNNAITALRNTCYSANSYVRFSFHTGLQAIGRYLPMAADARQGTCRCCDNRNLFECTSIVTPSRSH